jgi:hypothetical protein
MPDSSKDHSEKNPKTQASSLLCFDVHWLSGQKTSPDPLPTRQEYQILQVSGRPVRRRFRRSVNILASFIGVGLLCALGYGLYQSRSARLVGPSEPIAKESPKWTTEQQRQADETIEAILALQEMAAAQSEPNPPTHKR